MRIFVREAIASWSRVNILVRKGLNVLYNLVITTEFDPDELLWEHCIIE
jgi:hypothetical protein